MHIGKYSAAILLSFAATRHQLAFWKDSESLFRHALAVTQNNDLAHGNLAAALSLKGRLDDAIDHLREAARLKPANPVAHGNLGTALHKNASAAEIESGIP